MVASTPFYASITFMFNAVGKIYLALKQMRRLEVIATLFCPITDTSSSHWSSSPTCSPRPPRSTPRPHPGGLRVSWPAPGPGAPPGSAVSQRASAVRGGRGCRWSLRLWPGCSPPPRAVWLKWWSGWPAPAPAPCRWRGTWCSGSGCSPAPAPRPRRSPGRRCGTAWAPPSPPAPPCAGRRRGRSSSSGLQWWLRWPGDRDEDGDLTSEVDMARGRGTAHLTWQDQGGICLGCASSSRVHAASFSQCADVMQHFTTLRMSFRASSGGMMTTFLSTYM